MHVILRKVVAMITGILFLVLAGVLAAGLGLLSDYPLWLRLVTSIVVGAYGVFRARFAWQSEAQDV